MIFLLSTLFAAMLLTTSAFADDHGPTTVEMGARTFLVGQVPEAHKKQKSFFPINSVDWIHAIMNIDPVMGARRVVFYLGDERPSLADYNRTGFAAYHFGSSDLVPDAFRIEGIDVQVNSDAPQPFASYLYLDGGDDPSWMSSCNFDRPFDGSDESFAYCLMTLTYPADPDLHVGLRIYSPPAMPDIGASFPALAARAVEILICLDVTHNIPATPAEGYAQLALLRAENPELRSCNLQVAS